MLIIDNDDIFLQISRLPGKGYMCKVDSKFYINKTKLIEILGNKISQENDILGPKYTLYHFLLHLFVTVVPIWHILVFLFEIQNSIRAEQKNSV